MKKKVLSVLLALSLLLGTFGFVISASAESSADFTAVDALLTKFPDEHNLFFYTDEAIAKVEAAYAMIDRDEEDQDVVNAYLPVLQEALNFLNEKYPGSSDYAGLYKNRDESKAIIDFKLASNSATGKVQRGDTVKLTWSFTNNYWLNSLNAGIFYDNQIFEFVSFTATTQMETLHTVKTTSSPTNSMYPSTWSAAKKAQTGIVVISLLANPTTNAQKERIMATTETIIGEFTFKVKDAASFGNSQFYMSDECSLTMEDINRICIWQEYSRAAKQFGESGRLDDNASFGQSASLANLTLNVYEPVALTYVNLKTAIDTKPDYYDEGEDYYGDTWAPYATALAAAEALYAAQDAETQDEIDAATAALTDAYGDLALLPASYTALNAAIADKPEYFDEGDEYYGETWDAYDAALTAAINVDPDLKINDQGIIDAATTALTTARSALVLLDADYTKLDAAILDKPEYFDEGEKYYGDTWAAYKKALDDVFALPRDLKVNDQGILDAATTALTDAQGKLVLLNASYTALDAAIADKPEDYENGATVYTQATWDAYTAALEAALAVDRNLKINDQGIIDAAEATLVAAKAALEKVKAATKVISVTAPDPYYIGQATTLVVKVSGSPSKIQFVDILGNTTTYAQSNVNVIKIEKDGDDSIWYINKTMFSYDQYLDVYAKYDTWEEPAYRYTVEFAAPVVDIIKITVPDSYQGRILRGYHNIEIEASTQISKIQFVDKNGSTRTYSDANTNTTITAKDATTNTWVINFNFDTLGNVSYDLLIRAASGSWVDSGKKVEMTVLL